MGQSVKEIAKFLGEKVVGNENIVIKGIGGIEDAEEGDLSFIADTDSLPLLNKTKASCVLVPRSVKKSAISIIRTENPASAFIKIINNFFPYNVPRPEGVSSRAIIDKTARLGEGVSVGPYVVIEKDSEIGENSVIYPFCYIGANTKIGKDSILYPTVTIREGVLIGDRVIIHSGSVIGSDGFGYLFDKGAHVKIPQLGTVIIEDDVELGSNTSVDRARFTKTVIAQGTKIDNLVQVAHNVNIGKHCIVAAQTGIAGSADIGNYVIFGGQVGVVDHVKVGDRVKAGAQCGITKNIPPDSILWGTPAKPMSIFKKTHASVSLLPKLYERVKALEKKVEELEKK